MKARHCRQVRLAEVGEDGQRKIAAISSRVRGSGVAAKVEACYLAGAGVGRIVVEDASVGSSATEVDALVVIRVSSDRDRDGDRDRDPAWAVDLASPARDVALGAHRALRVIRRAALEDPP
jgi:hypothetical protein